MWRLVSGHQKCSWTTWVVPRNHTSIKSGWSSPKICKPSWAKLLQGYIQRTQFSNSEVCRKDSFLVELIEIKEILIVNFFKIGLFNH